jgi:hypothetical protein
MCNSVGLGHTFALTVRGLHLQAKLDGIVLHLIEEKPLIDLHVTT